MSTGSPPLPRARLLFGRDAIARRVAALGAEVSRDFAGGDLVLLGVLTGAFVFLADLARTLSIPARVDFVGVSSYGAGATPGPPTVTKEPSLDLRGRDVLLVEDLVDTGASLVTIRELVAPRAPRSLRACALLDKRWRRATEVSLDYVGFTIERGFVVGYGIDHAGEGRCLPDLWALPE